MDVKQLNYFVQIAKYGSYSLASQKALYFSACLEQGYQKYGRRDGIYLLLYLSEKTEAYRCRTGLL